MDFSKFKLELYDLLALLLPGFLSVCGIWVLLRGWTAFAVSLSSLSATGFTSLLLASFPLGHLIQELGDATIKWARGERFFKRPRDDFWKTPEGQIVNRTIEQELGNQLSVDGAFDYCLTKIKGQFPRRDTFLTTSDFCRSLLVVGFLLIPTAGRIVWDVHTSGRRMFAYGFGVAVALSAALYLAARRMMRYRVLSETPVFRTYLACVRQAERPAAELDLAASAGDE